MKCSLFFLLFSLFFAGTAFSQVGINYTGAPPAASSILEVKGHGGNSFMIDDNSGYLGMNVPAGMNLDIYDASGAAFIRMKSTGSTWDYDGVRLIADDPSQLYAWQIVHRSDPGNSNNNKFIIYSLDNTVWSTAVDRFCILPDGKAGIGTLVPAERLHVIGNVRADNFWTPAKSFQNGDSPVNEPLQKLKLLHASVITQENQSFVRLQANNASQQLPQIFIAGSAGQSSVDMDAVVPLLIAGIQKQEAQLRKNQKDLQHLNEVLNAKNE